MDCVIFQIFNTVLSISSKNVPPTYILPKRIENIISIKIKSGYYLEFLSPETMEFLKNIENKITKDKNDENKFYLEITGVILVHGKFKVYIYNCSK